MKNRLFKVSTSCGLAGRSSFISGELKDCWDSICLWLTGALLWPPRMPPWTASVHFPDSYPILSAQFQFSLFSADTLGYLSQWFKPALGTWILCTRWLFCQSAFVRRLFFLVVWKPYLHSWVFAEYLHSPSTSHPSFCRECQGGEGRGC